MKHVHVEYSKNDLLLLVNEDAEWGIVLPPPKDAKYKENVVAKKTQTEKEIEKQKAEQFKKDHQEFKDKAAKAKQNRETMRAFLDSPVVSPVLKRFETQIEATKEALCTGEKKDFERLQAEVSARRVLLSSLRGAYDEECQQAENALREFERSYSLFINNQPDEEEELQAKAN